MFPFRKFGQMGEKIIGSSLLSSIDLINATGTIKEVMQIILKEFEYQSSLELSSETFDSISHIPVATQIGIHARQVTKRRFD
jgi:adenylate kinase